MTAFTQPSTSNWHVGDSAAVAVGPIAKAHRVDLVLRNGVALVRLAGDIDLAGASDVHQLLENLDSLKTVVNVDLADVQFMDSSGLQPLIEATRRRNRLGLPPVLIGQCSPAVLRLLVAAGLHVGDGFGLVLDVDAWDRLDSACLGFGVDEQSR